LRFEKNVSLDRDGGFDWPQNPQVPPKADDPFAFLPQPNIGKGVADPLPPAKLNPDAAPRLPGAILGYSMGHFSYTDPETKKTEERAILMPGDEIFIATVGASGTKPVSATFIIADFFKSEMSEYDSSFVYVPLEGLQRIRGMDNRVNAVQIRLKDGVRNDDKFVHKEFVPALQELMPKPEAQVQSWQQQQGPLLEAIDIERGILNVLLFLIIGVAGFGVLAIFSMIVSEKYRDIGVMKSLGASSSGILGIFLSYGLMLGVVGCLLGTVVGLLFTHNINEIEAALSSVTGRQIFDRKIYYFDQIPTNVETLSVVLVNLGALAICVMSSVLPALRAARLHPVQALRFE
jgi:lipoprotein-releasing system permease protein